MEKILVAASGGVDSSVAALLMKQNNDITLATLLMTQCGAQAAKEAAAQLNVPHIVIDERKYFEEHTIDYFVKAYAAGLTPNPCIYCNRYVKFEKILQFAHANGFDKVATGHFAFVEYNKHTGRYEIKKGKDKKKDQSYMLYRLTQEQLSKVILPLGGFDKTEIRLMAEKAGLSCAHLKDSQDICFLPDGNYAGFVEKRLAQGNDIGPAGKQFAQGNYAELAEKEPAHGNNTGPAEKRLARENNAGLAEKRLVQGNDAELVEKQPAQGNNQNECRNMLMDVTCPGIFTDTEGRILGEHKGMLHYTIGQRKGLGISFSEPLYVKEKDMERNIIVLCTEKELYTHEVRAGNLNWVSIESLKTPMHITAKIRYSQNETAGLAFMSAEDELTVKFQDAVRAPAPGQSVVLYDGDTVVGGGIIKNPCIIRFGESDS